MQLHGSFWMTPRPNVVPGARLLKPQQLDAALAEISRLHLWQRPLAKQVQVEATMPIDASSSGRLYAQANNSVALHSNHLFQ